MKKRAKIIGTFAAIAVVGLVAIHVFYNYVPGFFENSKATAELTEVIKEKTKEIKNKLKEELAVPRDQITPEQHADRISKCHVVMRSYEARKDSDAMLNRFHDGMSDDELACFEFLRKLPKAESKYSEEAKEEAKPKPEPKAEEKKEPEKKSGGFWPWEW